MAIKPKVVSENVTFPFTPGLGGSPQLITEKDTNTICIVSKCRFIKMDFTMIYIYNYYIGQKTS